MEINNSELIIYGNKTLSISLSKKQLYTVLKILGIKFQDDNYSCFSDEFLEKLINNKEFKNKNIINKDWELDWVIKQG